MIVQELVSTNPVRRFFCVLQGTSGDYAKSSSNTLSLLTWEMRLAGLTRLRYHK